MRTIVFATSNKHKIKEVNEMLQGLFRVVSLKDIGCNEEVPETSPTIRGNAVQKARYVNKNYQTDCFSEDTGLEIDALNGEPGVLTARYAGQDRNADANMELVLEKLTECADRTARFRTVIALILGGKEYIFEGIAEGHIAKEKKGQGGFGYDPIFIPQTYKHSFAEMNAEEKNDISHRGKAIKQLKTFLLSY